MQKQHKEYVKFLGLLADGKVQELITLLKDKVYETSSVTKSDIDRYKILKRVLKRAVKSSHRTTVGYTVGEDTFYTDAYIILALPAELTPPGIDTLPEIDCPYSPNYIAPYQPGAICNLLATNPTIDKAELKAAAATGKTHTRIISPQLEGKVKDTVDTKLLLEALNFMTGEEFIMHTSTNFLHMQSTKSRLRCAIILKPEPAKAQVTQHHLIHNLLIEGELSDGQEKDSLKSTMCLSSSG